MESCFPDIVSGDWEIIVRSQRFLISQNSVDWSQENIRNSRNNFSRKELFNKNSKHFIFNFSILTQELLPHSHFSITLLTVNFIKPVTSK
jgi:hypothetical protein